MAQLPLTARRIEYTPWGLTASVVVPEFCRRVKR